MERRPPPGAFATVIEAVPAVAISAASTSAVNRCPLTNVVAREAPLNITLALVANPTPFTVRVNPAPPGAALGGSSGCITNGTSARATRIFKEAAFVVSAEGVAVTVAVCGAVILEGAL